MKLTHSGGVAAENKALNFLQKEGLRLIVRNWHCRGGEIDLIMQDGDTLVFVEVRHRTSNRFGGALASVTSEKCRKLQYAANAYISTHNINAPCRFDLVLYDGDIKQSELWLKNIIA